MDILVPFRDILDLLEVMDYNEKDTIDKLVFQIDSDLQSHNTPVKSLRILHYLLLHKRHINGQSTFSEHILKSCLNFLAHTNIIDIPASNLIESIIDTCLNNNDIKFLELALVLLLQYSDKQLTALSAGNKDFDNRDLLYLFIILEKVCNVKLAISFGLEAKFKDFSNIIFDLIVRLVRASNLTTYMKNRLAAKLPKFVAAQDDNKFLEALWLAIAELDCADEQLAKQLFFLCSLSDNYLTLFSTTSSYPLYKSNAFWVLLQRGIISNNNISRKIALYLLRNYIYTFYKSDVDYDGALFHWKHEHKDVLIDFWEKMFLLFETLEESQVHLIMPALKSVPQLYSLSKSKNYYSWLLCIFERIISHPAFTIVKWGLKEFCNLDPNFLLSDWKCSKLLCTFFSCMNNMFLYSAPPHPVDDNLQASLTKLFVSMSLCELNEHAFEVMLECLISTSWSPIPLYFISDSISRVQGKKLLNVKCLSYIKRILSETLKTQSILIRCTIQSRLLKCITNLCQEEIDFTIVLNLLGTFNGNESLVRGTSTWGNCVKWLKFSSYSQNSDLLIQLTNDKIKYDLSIISIEACARGILLFRDTNIDQISRSILAFVQSILDNFENSEKRKYACPEVQDRSLEFISAVIDGLNVCSNEAEGDKLFNQFKENITLLLSYIASKLKQGTDVNIKQIKLYETLIKIIFSHSILRINEFLPLYTLCFDLLQSNISFQKCLSIKIIHIIYQFICNYGYDKGKYVMPYEHLLLDIVFRKNLFDKSNPGIVNCEPIMRGKLMSEISNDIWSLFYLFVSNNKYFIQSIIDSFQIALIIEISITALNEAGKKSLIPILKTFSVLLPYNENENDGSEFIERSWQACFELRKNELFWPAITEWVRMIYQDKIVQRGEYRQLILKYASEIIACGEELVGLADILFSQVMKLNISSELSSILSDGLTFGSIARKDWRKENEVCQYILKQVEEGSIESFGKSMTLRNDKEVRIKALVALFRSKNKNNHNKLISNVVSTLLEYDLSLNKNCKRYFNDSIIHRSKHRILQAILIIENYIFNSQSPELNETPLQMFNWTYENLKGLNQQPSVRYQLEWLYVRLCLHYQDCLVTFWNHFEQAGLERLGSMCSFISISYHLTLVIKNEILVQQCFENILPWCMSQNFNVRLYAQVVISKLWELSPQLSADFHFIKRSQWRVLEPGNALANAKKMQSDFYFSVFHPVNHFSLKTIFWDLPRLSNISSEEWINCGILEKYSDILGIPTKTDADILLEKCTSPLWITKGTGEIEGDSESNSIQKKFIPWKGLLTDADTPVNQPKSSVVLVASLIDKAANLGGLARTSEIFAVKELVIPNLEIVKDKEFLGLSMTAEKHLNITEVKPYNLQEYMKIMKNRGYTLVGLEQTTGSASLVTYKFPRDCLLLLGSEREGIPANLIPLLDCCVEIPQLGVIRSLNVHVSGALVLWEYSKQHSFLIS